MLKMSTFSDDFKYIADTFATVDGGVKLVKFRWFLSGLEKEYLNGYADAKEIFDLIHQFRLLIQASQGADLSN